MPNETDTNVRALPAQMLKSITQRTDAITSATSRGRQTVREAQYSAMSTTATAHFNLGQYLAENVVKRANLKTSATASDILAAFKDQTSGVYVAADQRSDLPSKSVAHRALVTFRTWRTPSTLAEGLAVYDWTDSRPAFGPGFMVWQTIHAGTYTGEQTCSPPTVRVSVDKSGNVTESKGKGSRQYPGQLQSVPKTPATPDDVKGWDGIERLQPDALRQMVHDSGLSLDEVATSKLRVLARTAIAVLTLRSAETSEVPADDEVANLVAGMS